jgi:hypothetical protein
VVPTVCCARPTHGTARVMAAEVVSHAFSQGFHPEHSQPLAACWAESLGGRTTYSDCYGGETLLCGCRGAPGLLHRREHTLVTEYGLRVLSDFRRLGMQLDVAADLGLTNPDALPPSSYLPKLHVLRTGVMASSRSATSGR